MTGNYSVVSETSLDEFIQQVNEAMHAGWIPLGGMSVVVSRELGVFVYFQAMTIKDEGETA